MRTLFVTAWLLLSATSLAADPTPFGLQQAGERIQWESGDAQAQQVQSLFLPHFNNDFNQNHLDLGKGFRNLVNEITPPNPQRNPFQIAGPQNGGELRVYFVDETSGWQNSLGIVQSTPSKGMNPLEASPTNETMLFSNASTDISDPLRSQSAPVKPMDYVDLGTINEGELFELFFIADGGDLQKDGSGTYDAATIDFADPNAVPARGILFSDPNHNLTNNFLSARLRIFEVVGNDDLTLISIQAKSDRGLESVFMLLELTTPEPGTYLILASFLALFAFIRTASPNRRRA